MATVLMGLQLHQDPILRVSSLHMYQSQLSCFFLPIHAVLPHPLGDTPYYFFSAYYYMPYPLCGSLTAFFRMNDYKEEALIQKNAERCLFMGKCRRFQPRFYACELPWFPLTNWNKISAFAKILHEQGHCI